MDFSNESSDDDMVLDYILWRKLQDDRTVWVKEIFLHREQQGEFHVLVPQLWRDPFKFQNYFRMSQKCFTLLVDKVKPAFSIGQTNYRKSIGFLERLTLPIRFLANGESFASASYRFRISPNHISTIVHNMLQLLYDVLQMEYPKFPSKQDWLQIAEDYEKKKYFPNCIGAIDGKHIRIKKPKNCGSLYFNYKLYHSIVLLSLEDANYKFIMIDVGSYGRNSDGGIFKKSEFGKQLNSGTLELPGDRPIEEGGEAVPYVIVADEAFQLTKNRMKPYPRKLLNREKRIFNYRLSFTRTMVECTFGILASKFRVFTTAIAVAPENVDRIIKTACTLHNMIRVVDCEVPDVKQTFRQGRSFVNLNQMLSRRNLNQSTRYARHVREAFTNYFCGPGATDFQDAVIAARDGMENE